MLERQTQSDIKMMELEEKRLWLEEKVLEREAQQQREDRKFQMKCLQILMGHSYYPGHQTNMPMGLSSYGTGCMYGLDNEDKHQ